MRHISLGAIILLLTSLSPSASEVGERFPDFTLKDLGGRNVSFSRFRGKVLLLDFWMTTCPPCKEEMPIFQELQRKYGDRGLVVVGISLDEKPKTASAFARKLGIRYTLLIHPTLMTSESEQQRFGIVGLPTTFLIDRHGIIRHKVVGFQYKEQFEKHLEILLAQ